MKPPRAAQPQPAGRGQGGARPRGPSVFSRSFSRGFSRSFRPQRGLSLITLLLWAVLLAALVLAALRVLPSVNQYYAVRRAVEKLVGTSLNPADIRADFDKQRAANPEISVLRGDDLDIRRDGDHLVIRFAYDKQIELVHPVYLLIKYHGRSR